MKNVQVKEVLQEIELKTDFKFLYNTNKVNSERIVSVNIRNKKISDVLDELFKDTDIKYVLQNRLIILKAKLVSFKIADSLISFQQQRITGVVKDPNGDPLLGVTVRVKGSIRGTSTDENGRYLLFASPTAILSFTYIGFEDYETPVAGREVIDVTMTEAVEAIDEVVLIGYGEVKRENLTGSVSTVNIESFKNQAPTVNIEQGLQGQVAGLQVTIPNGQPGAAAKIRIRGTSSLSGSNQPLFVIDGIPVVPESNIPRGGTEGQLLGNELANQGLSTPIANLNPNDIESISVLKDASAAAIYGSRAANGVIIINTKRGTKKGKTTFNIDASTIIQQPRTLEVLNAQQFREVWTTAVMNSSRDDAFTRSVLDGSYFGDADTNWENEVGPGTPVSTNVNASLRGGNEKTQFALSLAALNSKSGFEGSESERFTLNLNLNTGGTSALRFGTSIQTSFFDQSSLDGGIVDGIYSYRPDIPVFDEDGNFAFSPNNNFQNPVALAQASNSNKTFLFLGTFFTQLDIVKGLTAETRLSVNYNNGNQVSFYPRFTNRGGWSRLRGNGDGFAQDSRSNSIVLQWQSTLTYKRLFANVHQIDAVLGTTFEEITTSNNKAFGTGFSNKVLSNVTNATVSRGGSSFESGSGLVSYFGRVNYDYDQKYLLTFTARVDGSSKFAEENKYAFFPAAAAAWRISRESFLANSKYVDELKLRASYGLTGQQDFGPYQWRTLFETDDYGGEPSVLLSQLGNSRLKWETTKQLDLGIDFSLFEGRLSGGIAYYRKDTEDAIFPVITPGNTGVTSVLANVGSTRNEGVELLINATLLQSDTFSWDVSLNAARNKNQLTGIAEDFLDDEGFIVGFPGLGGGRLRVGSPIGLIYGYVAEGIFQNQNEIDALNAAAPNGVYQDDETSPGDIRFRDISGPEGVPDGIVNNFDQEVIGNAQPDIFGGFTSTWRYKGFTLAAQFTYSIGNDLLWFSQTRAVNFGSTFAGENKVTDVLNAWTPENPTNQPRLVYRDPNNNGRISSFYVHDASFLRLNTLNLRYTFSRETMDKIGVFDGISIYGIAQNLWTITSYPGANPEGGTLFNNDISGAGRDTNRFPIQKAFTLGINLSF